MTTTSCRIRTRASFAQEVNILIVEENGAETCRLSPNSSFVLVWVPIRVEGEGERGEATADYRIGGFHGRGTALTLQAGLHTVLRFRIPQELFRDRERFSVEIRTGASAGPQTLLWRKRWEVAWRGEIPSLEPVADLIEDGADSWGGVPGPEWEQHDETNRRPKGPGP